MPRFVKGRLYMNDPDPVVHEALRWLRFSEEDLNVASRLMTGIPTAPRHACWLSQQAAEKALKAALVLEEVEFPFTHDLDALRNLLPGSWSVRDAHPDLALSRADGVGSGNEVPRRLAGTHRCRRDMGGIPGPSGPWR